MHSIITEVQITEDQIQRAKKLYDFNNIKNSITKGKSQIYGALGEIIVMDFLNMTMEANYLGNRDADLVYLGKTIDVKTKKSSSKPKNNYYNSIAKHSLVQSCDLYYFIRIHKDMGLAWICGQISKKEFMTLGKYFCKGDIDTTSLNFKFREDCMNLEIGKCYPIVRDKLDFNFFSKHFKTIKKNGYFINDNILINNKYYSLYFLPLRKFLVIKTKDNKVIISQIISNYDQFKSIFKEKFNIYVK